MSDRDKQVSVSWKYTTQVLLGVLIVGFGWFGTTVWGRLDKQAETTAIIPVLSERIEALTKSVDRLTQRLDNAAVIKVEPEMNINTKDGRGK